MHEIVHHLDTLEQRAIEEIVPDNANVIEGVVSTCIPHGGSHRVTCSFERWNEARPDESGRTSQVCVFGFASQAVGLPVSCIRSV